MSDFMTFSEKGAERRHSMRVSEDGDVTLLVSGLHGEIIQDLETTIDPLRARELVADALLAAGTLDNSHGNVSLGVGHGEGEPTIVTFDPAHSSPDVAQLLGEVRGLFEEVRRSAPPPQDDIRPATSNGVSAGGFALWTGAFFLGHVVGGGIGLLAMLLVIKVMGGFLSLLAGGAALLLCVLGAYFIVGYMYGRRYGDRADAWKPAAAAVLLPAIVTALAGGGFKVAVLSSLMPMSAAIGAHFGR